MIFEWFAALIVLGAFIPIGRLVLDTDFARVFPLHHRLSVTAMAVVVAGVAAALLWRREWLAPLALVSASLALLAAVRARPRRWKRSNLPPGSLSITDSIRGLARRESLLELGERHGPVFTMSSFGRPVIGVIGLERGQRLVREHRDSIGPSPLAFNAQIMGGFLRYMDDDTHDVYGPLLRRAMSRPVTDFAEPVARSTIRACLSALPSNWASPDADLQRVAYETLLFALFGIDATSDLGSEFRRSYDAFCSSGVIYRRQWRTAAALDELRRIVAARAATYADTTTAVPRCAIAELRLLNAAMPDETCIDNLLFMLRIGSDNVASLMRWVLEHLGSDPLWRERLAAATSPELYDAFVAEVLRLSQSEYLYRRLLDDIEFEGVVLPAGWLVRLCVWESHRDPSIYDMAEQATDRFVDGRRPQSEYCPFGFDRHACNSVGVALMMVRTVLEEVVADHAVTIRPAGDVVRGFRHWSHWRPGPSLALARHSSGM